MAATIAHEINNPLAAVMNTLFLARTSADSPAVRQYLDIADEEVKRIAHLTRQSLGFYRESSAPAPVKLGDVLDSAIDLLTAKARAKGAIIRREGDDSASVTGVPGELRHYLFGGAAGRGRISPACPERRRDRLKQRSIWSTGVPSSQAAVPPVTAHCASS